MRIKQILLFFPFGSVVLFSFGLYSFFFFFRFRFFVSVVGLVCEGIFVSSFLSFYGVDRLRFFYLFDFFFRVFSLNYLFFFKIILIGLGFNVVYFEDIGFRFYLGYSHYIYFFPAFWCRAFCNNKNKFLVFGFSRDLIRNLLLCFLSLRRSNIYKMCGVYRQRIFSYLKDNRHNK